MNKRTIIPVVAVAIALGYGTADTAFADMRHRSHHGPHGRHRGMEYGHDRPPADAATIQQRHVRKYAGELKEMFDTSHDGTLSANERAKMLSEMADAERLQRYVLPWRVIREIDADSDFLVTDQELESFSSATEKVRREYEERRAQRATNPAMRHGGGHRSGRADRPKGADGIKLWRDFDKATPADLKTFANDLRRKYDKDGDGKLTGDERTTLDAELSARRNCNDTSCHGRLSRK